ncbi:transglycosylase domain-containing protein [Lachnospiraceae bacterium C1.1]|nr:PBP1A family penicillin-binding protein [Lachnospiraceae bacterium C1.1]
MNYSKSGARKRLNRVNSIMPGFSHMLTVFVAHVSVIAVIAAVVVSTAAVFGVFKGVIASSPEINDSDIRPVGYSSVIYDSEGNQTTKLVAADSNRIYMTIDKIPLDLQHAFVAIEDERFYTHNGIDLKGIVRAAITGITSRDFSQGASTITQQLIKNNVFTSWTSESSFAEKLKRKIQEQFLAVELEKQDGVTKDTILELYLNTINLGQNTLGVQAASLRYFNKNVSELNLSECAVIAGITQNPSKYNPISHPDNNAVRREKVLTNMLDQGYITQSAYEEAMEDDVYSRIQVVNAKAESNSVNSYFVDALTNQILSDMVEKLGYTETQAYNQLYSGGLSIYTTQDPEIQGTVDEITQNEENYPSGTKYLLDYSLTVSDSEGEYHNYSSEMMQDWFADNGYSSKRLFSSEEEAEAASEAYKDSILSEGYTFVSESFSTAPQPQISLSIIDQKTGEVKAIVGGRGKKDASLTLNRATDTTRQPGSTFKVVSTYAPAFDSAGLTLASTEVDEPFSYSNGRPVSNWYSGYKGLCTLRYGIEQSLNIIAVKTLTKITPELGFKYLQDMGFTTLVESRTNSSGQVFSDVTQTLALGGITDGVKNIELNAAYASIANGGIYCKPRFYTKIIDHDGNVLINNSIESKRVLKATTAYLLTSAMQDVITQGTGKFVNFDGMSIAGKTGTTSDNKDVWFAGYSPYYCCTTWAGYDNNVQLSTSDEQHLAKTMWKLSMKAIHENLENKDFTKPDGIVEKVVCKKSGKLAVDGLCTVDGSAYKEIFDKDNCPTETCTMHVSGYVCAETGLRANDTCPYKTMGVYIQSEDGGGTEYCPHNVANGYMTIMPDMSALYPNAVTPATGTDSTGDSTTSNGSTGNTTTNSTATTHATSASGQ